MGNVIEFENVSLAFDNQPVLRNINLEVNSGDFMAILGPNGGGKTTVLKLILGLLIPDKGRIRVLGKDPERVRKNIGYVPQYGLYDREFPIKVKEVVMMSALNGKSLLPWYNRSTCHRAFLLLKQLGIEHLADKKLGELSGGQQQRVLIARALMADPEILLLDEPTASVDASVEKDIYVTLKQLNESKTIILVSHDISFVSAYVNKVTCLNICSCTHKLEEIESNSLIDIYNNSIKYLHHQCNL